MTAVCRTLSPLGIHVTASCLALPPLLCAWLPYATPAVRSLTAPATHVHTLYRRMPRRIS